MQIGNMESDSFSGDLYFPTMIFKSKCEAHEELNAYLLKLIYAEKENDQQGIERSNFRSLGGWHSHNNLHKNADFSPLTDRIHQIGERISIQLGYAEGSRLEIGTMWSIINAPGASNKTHIHPGAHWNGVYYVQAPKNSGAIEFTDPRTANIMTQPKFKSRKKRARESWTKVKYSPDAGKMLVFPSWLYHGVEPNICEQKDQYGDRVIVSFNLFQQPN